MVSEVPLSDAWYLCSMQVVQRVLRHHHQFVSHRCAMSVISYVTSFHLFSSASSSPAPWRRSVENVFQQPGGVTYWRRISLFLFYSWLCTDRRIVLCRCILDSGRSQNFGQDREASSSVQQRSSLRDIREKFNWLARAQSIVDGFLEVRAAVSAANVVQCC